MVYNGAMARDARTYSSWSSMKYRCYNQKYEHYDRYGGRGITVCDRWLDPKKGYDNFLKDMGVRPAGKTLDRIDNDGNYCPENCRWATQKEQLANSSKVLKAKVTKEELAKSPCCMHTVYDRLSKGWSKEAALFTPPADGHKNLIPNVALPRRKCRNCGKACKTAVAFYCSKHCYIQYRYYRREGDGDEGSKETGKKAA